MSRSQQAPHRTLLSFFVSQPPQSCPNYITPRSRSDIMIHLRHLIAMPSLSSPPYNPLPKKARNATLLSLSPHVHRTHFGSYRGHARQRISLSLSLSLTHGRLVHKGPDYVLPERLSLSCEHAGSIHPFGAPRERTIARNPLRGAPPIYSPRGGCRRKEARADDDDDYCCFFFFFFFGVCVAVVPPSYIYGRSFHERV